MKLQYSAQVTKSPNIFQNRGQAVLFHQCSYFENFNNSIVLNSIRFFRFCQRRVYGPDLRLNNEKIECTYTYFLKLFMRF